MGRVFTPRAIAYGVTERSKGHGEVEGHWQWLLKGGSNKLNDACVAPRCVAAGTTMLYLASKQTVGAQTRVGQWIEGEFSKVRALTSPGQPSRKRTSSVKKKEISFSPSSQAKKSAFLPVKRQAQSSRFLKKLKSKNPHSYMSIFPLKNVGYLHWISSFLKFKICSPPHQ